MTLSAPNNPVEARGKASKRAGSRSSLHLQGHSFKDIKAAIRSSGPTPPCCTKHHGQQRADAPLLNLICRWYLLAFPGIASATK